MSNDLIKSIVEVIGVIGAAIITSLFWQRLQAKAQMKQANAVSDQTEADIDKANIQTALSLIEPLRKQNAELSVRAAALETASIELTRQVNKLKLDLEAVQEGAKRLYYQVKGFGHKPVYEPPNITRPMEANQP